MDEPKYLEEMIWIPGRGPDEELLRALASRYSKPRDPLGEAWFIGETRAIYHDINKAGAEAISNSRLSGYLETTLGGLMSFSETADWSQWYGHITTQILVSRRYLEARYFISQMQEGVFLLSFFNEAHPAHADQSRFAALLAPILMEKTFWSGQSYIPFWTNHPKPSYWDPNWKETSISRSLFLAWRYLQPEAIHPWFKSVLVIPDLRWRACLIAWLVQLQPIFASGSATISFSLLMVEPRKWPEFGNLFIPFKYHSRSDEAYLVTPENVEALQAALRMELTEEKCFQWLEDFYSIPEMGPPMEIWLEQFQQLFLH